MIEELLGNSTFEQAKDELLALGWDHVGTSNWCEILADPNDEIVVRLSPFDPSQTLYARLCMSQAENRWMPRVHAIVEQQQGGDAVVMERLWPAALPKASALVAAIDIPSDTGFPKPKPSDAISRFEPHVIALRDGLRKMLAEGQSRYKVWGGSDVREGKILTDAKGEPKLIDPAFLNGPHLRQAIELSDMAILQDFTREELLGFLRLPYFTKNVDLAMQRKRLERVVMELDLPERDAA